MTHGWQRLPISSRPCFLVARRSQIQAKALELEDPLAVRIIEDHLHYLETKNYVSLIRALKRSPEVEVLPACHHYRLGVVPYSPVARGVLTAITWIISTEFPLKVFATRADAMTWCDQQLVEAKKQVAMAIADEKKLQKQYTSETDKAKEWERKAMVAVRAGDDNLARQALARKQERPLPFEDRRDRRLRDVWDEYLFGPDLLVAPVWRSGARSARPRCAGRESSPGPSRTTAPSRRP